MIKLSASIRKQDILPTLSLFAKDQRPAFRKLKRPVLADQRDHRKSRMGAKGRWPDRAESTKERYRLRRRGGNKPARNLLGRLPAALIVKIEKTRMTVTSRVPWSGVHQRGGRAGRGGRVVIPKREFLWISRRLRRQVLVTMLRTAGGKK